MPEYKTEAFTSVAFRADGKFLAYSLYDAIYLWKTSTEKPEKPVKLLTVPDNHYIRAVKFHPNSKDQNILAYASSDGTVRLWDTQGNNLLGLFAGNAENQWLSCIKQECLCSGKACLPDIAQTGGNVQNAPNGDKQLATPLVTKNVVSPELITTIPPVQTSTANKDEETNKVEPDQDLVKEMTNEKLPSQVPIHDEKERDKTESERENAESDKDLALGVANEKPSSQVPILDEKEKRGKTDSDLEYGFYIAVFFLILLLLVAAIALYRRSIIQHHTNLLETPLPQLPQKHHLLKRARCLAPILAKKQISAEKFNDAIAFVQTTSPLKQTKILATRIEAKHWEQTEEDLFMMVMHENFPINLPFFSLYFLTPDQTIGEIVDKLHQHRNLAIQKVIVITQDF
jgi:hypothetical protein